MSKIKYSQYKKAARIAWHDWIMVQDKNTDEVKNARKICRLYEKQNKYNPFSFLEPMYETWSNNSYNWT